MQSKIGLLFVIVFAVGCAGDGQRSRPAKLDYCDCELWGVSGVEPEPGYQPPPRPRACARILKQKHAGHCPIPP
jgi:hypothetical protein